MKIENVTKNFGSKKVLQNLNIEIKEGMTTCIMAPSGAGKTTFLRILMGLESADSGKTAGVEGKRFSAVFQEERLCENLNAVENVRLAAPKADRQQIIKELEKLGLKDCFSQPVAELSGGMRRRVSILRALLAEYDVLCLDEPFKGLDLELKEFVISYVKEKTAGKTVVFVTHDRNEAAAMGADIIEFQKL